MTAAASILHCDFNVGVLDPVCVDEIRHAKNNRGRLFLAHRATSPSL